jgi:death-on-curing protein
MSKHQWKWLTVGEALMFHRLSIIRHGGLDGIRDKAALESAMVYPQNLQAYSDNGITLAELVAGYLFAIAKNHAFIDGNKRTAWIAAIQFLEINKGVLTFDDDDAIEFVENVAGGNMNFEDITKWFEERLS